MMPNPIDSEKKICPKAAAQTAGSGRAPQSGVNKRVEAFGGTGQEEGPHHEDRERHDQERDEDHRRRPDPLLDARHHDRQHHQPDERQRNQDAGDGIELDTRLPGLEEVTEEEALGVVAPRLAEREERVAHRPRDHCGVVDGDQEADPHLPPAETLGAAVQPCERQRCRPPVAVADGIVQEQERDPGGEQGHEVGDDERTAAVLVGDVREPPDVAQPHGRADGSEDEHLARPERAAGLLLRLDLGHCWLPSSAGSPA